MKISELAKLVGVAPSTIRWYDSHCQVKRTDPCL